jgi:hypothetical protein
MLSLALLAGVILAAIAGSRTAEVVLLLCLSVAGFAYLILRVREHRPEEKR